VSGLFGLLMAIVPGEAVGVVCCCGPLLCLPLAGKLTWMAWQELNTSGLDRAGNGLVLFLLMMLFSLALLMVFIHTCAVVVRPNLR